MNTDRKIEPNDRKEINMKKCRRCNNEYPSTPIFFRRNKDTEDKLSNYCKKCSSDIGKSHYIKFETQDRIRKGSVGVHCPLWNSNCGICNFPFACRRVEWADNDDIPSIYAVVD